MSQRRAFWWRISSIVRRQTGLTKGLVRGVRWYSRHRKRKSGSNQELAVVVLLLPSEKLEVSLPSDENIQQLFCAVPSLPCSIARPVTSVVPPTA